MLPLLVSLNRRPFSLRPPSPSMSPHRSSTVSPADAKKADMVAKREEREAAAARRRADKAAAAPKPSRAGRTGSDEARGSGAAAPRSARGGAVGRTGSDEARGGVAARRKPAGAGKRPHGRHMLPLYCVFATHHQRVDATVAYPNGMTCRVVRMTSRARD